ncbi:hypothetical protein ACH5RR_034111 [Cinchona calisaya]|uniref:Uncharacterized protein n=1 Tax=Cinchona calisaya TaxID=153742 RepID=A0ABD2YDJ5_9GENT
MHASVALELPLESPPVLTATLLILAQSENKPEQLYKKTYVLLPIPNGVHGIETGDFHFLAIHFYMELLNEHCNQPRLPVSPVHCHLLSVLSFCLCTSIVNRSKSS